MNKRNLILSGILGATLVGTAAANSASAKTTPGTCYLSGEWCSVNTCSCTNNIKASAGVTGCYINYTPRSCSKPTCVGFGETCQVKGLW
jgi:hypothetical protein